MQRRALTAALASATMALGGALAATTTVPAQGAEDSTSPLVLSAPDTVTVKSSNGWVFSNLGVRMRAVGDDFEIHATRSPTGAATEWWDPSYDSPITAKWQGAEGEVDLGEMSSWSGLDDFVSVKIFRRSDGQQIRDISAPGCINGNARKTGPAGPVSNPFPWGCPWNPYTLGSVMGLAHDYTTSLLPEWGTSLRLRPGTYRMVAGISDTWRQKLGVSEADGVVTTKLVVEKGRQRGGWSVAARRAAGSGTDNLEQTTEAPTSESAGAPVDEFAPDLRSLPAFDIGLNEQGTALRFGATVWNGGGGPMVIEGFREEHDHDHDAGRGPGGDDHSGHMTAYQYFFDGDGNQTGYEQVGEFNYHAANHNHWHFRDFARYRLLDADMELAVRSTKASFCLVATDAVDLTVPNADMRPEYTDLGSQCGGRRSQMLRQVLANGHGDTYHQFRAGQAFRVGALEDGIYYISVEANPDDANGRNLKELDITNNDSVRKIRLGTRPNGTRFVRTFQVGVIEEQGFENFRMR